MFAKGANSSKSLSQAETTDNKPTDPPSSLRIRTANADIETINTYDQPTTAAHGFSTRVGVLVQSLPARDNASLRISDRKATLRSADIAPTQRADRLRVSNAHPGTTRRR